MSQLMNFMKTTSPQDAKNQVEQMLQSGQLDQQQFNMLLDQARTIGSMFGIK